MLNWLLPLLATARLVRLSKNDERDRKQLVPDADRVVEPLVYCHNGRSSTESVTSAPDIVIFSASGLPTTAGV